MQDLGEEPRPKHLKGETKRASAGRDQTQECAPRRGLIGIAVPQYGTRFLSPIPER
jgi:hypothetical protein